jgi:hypothetical protein
MGGVRMHPVAVSHSPPALGEGKKGWKLLGLTLNTGLCWSDTFAAKVEKDGKLRS